MRTIALRFSDNFAPAEGTILAHDRIIRENGFVWYGKLGSAISKKAIDEILENDNPRILLIHSGKTDRYWAYIETIQHELPDKEYIPEYYRYITDRFRTWFRIIKFEKAHKNVLSMCRVSSSKHLLSDVSRSSMSPYFIIDMEE